MADLVERLVPEELRVLFRRVVPPTDVKRPQGGAGVELVTARFWRRSSLWLSRAAPGASFHRCSARLGRRSTGGFPSGVMTGCGPGSTVWSWTNSGPGV